MNPSLLSISDSTSGNRVLNLTTLTFHEQSLREMPLHNFLGLVYPAGDAAALPGILKKSADETVCLLSAESSVGACCNVSCRVTRHTCTDKSGVSLTSLPYADKEWDVLICTGVLESVIDPEAACRELQRTARSGFIECISPLSAVLGAPPYLRWLVYSEKTEEGKPLLVFRRRPFLRVPLHHALIGALHNDSEMRYNWYNSYRNITHTQMKWEGEFECRVEQGPEYYRPDDVHQYVEACLDAAICALRIGGVPPEEILCLTEEALLANSQNALAHNTHGCALWLAGRKQEARASFAKAVALDRDKPDYARNASLSPDASQWPSLVLLPLQQEDRQDPDANCMGTVYPAGAGSESRLLHALQVGLKDRVLETGIVSTPLLRADTVVQYHLQRSSAATETAGGKRQVEYAYPSALPFADDEFDFALCRNGMAQADDPVSACRELQRVAKRGFLEMPGILWECMLGHPAHRWAAEWNPIKRELVLHRRTFAESPFRNALAYVLRKYPFIKRSFETVYRNLANVQIVWDKDNAFTVRVECDESNSYDYYGSRADMVRGSMAYAREMLRAGCLNEAAEELLHAEQQAETAVEKEQTASLRRTIAAQAQTEGLPDVFGRKEPAVNKSDLKRTDLPILWHAPLKDPSGYAEEARNFLYALHENGIAVQAREIRWNNRVVPLAQHRQKLLDSMLNATPFSAPLYICHILGGSLQRLEGARACAGRTMFETDRLPVGWAEACNRMDAVWVPSEFNRQTFAEAGVKQEKLRVVPGAIDLAAYHPAVEKLRIAGARGFNFLAVFDWSLRKGWDVLLQAYVEEFREDEDVALLLQVHSSTGLSASQIIEAAGKHIAEKTGIDPAHAPDIVLQEKPVPDAMMPALYRAADCYVLPTRGEGWGRPYMEAMACAVPAIVTNWSGPTAFTTPDTALLLDYDIVPVSKAGAEETPTFAGHCWAEPSVRHLRQLMRNAFDERRLLRERGEHARVHLEENFSYSKVAAIVTAEAERLLQLGGSSTL